jgi:hypothetical protein
MDRFIAIWIHFRQIWAKKGNSDWIRLLVGCFFPIPVVIAKYDRVIGSIIVCASQDIAMLIVGRIINGLAVGASLLDLLVCTNIK